MSDSRFNVFDEESALQASFGSACGASRLSSYEKLNLAGRLYQKLRTICVQPAVRGGKAVVFVWVQLVDSLRGRKVLHLSPVLSADLFASYAARFPRAARVISICKTVVMPIVHMANNKYYEIFIGNIIRKLWMNVLTHERGAI